jgi:hypothetical protein
LAVVLIFGLASSTLLVVTVFPYYYLGAEYLRLRISKAMFFKWLALTAAVVVLVNVVTKNLGVALLVALAANVAWFVTRKVQSRRTA